ncbi:MAG TPA: LacI family DNA-binding transcriptional regulator [Aggregatilineales bacterium]|nr:LacI family DNA-binding transcriptional regulator [Anaerolineae bacterium]HUN08432.1 LacI family DNA-binding transcriptional regulator [Aggregatilineales bacterium]
MKLEDIAKKAKVSRSTASRVINNDRYVSADARQRVLKVIEQEQFEPNPAARTLVTRRSNIIGVAIPQTANVFFGDNSYYPMLLQGIAEAVNKSDHAMLLWLAESHEVRDVFAKRVVRHRQPDGLILTSVVDRDPLFEYMVKHNRSFVMVETPPAYADRVSYVTIDNVGAAAEATRHLIQIGRKRIAHITGQLTIQDGIDRLKGFRQTVAEAGLLYEELIKPGMFAAEFGYRLMQELIPLRPDAVFCGGDTAAIGAIRAIHEAGLRVPDDIAVVGFDDLDVATKITPALTTIRHRVMDIGSTAARLLIDLLDGRLEHPHHFVMPTELVIRGSTGGQG